CSSSIKPNPTPAPHAEAVKPGPAKNPKTSSGSTIRSGKIIYLMSISVSAHSPAANTMAGQPKAQTHTSNTAAPAQNQPQRPNHKKAARVSSPGRQVLGNRLPINLSSQT